ncbi:MAG: hypothetical protein LBR90_01470 [Elusimicrobiota bacterium]|jgi:hypothetical protein|nr:hypothetical protein [Elusimicrobiota bacterium]
MRKYLVLLISLLFAAQLSAQSIEQADKSFEAGLYKRAEQEYKPFLNDKKADARYHAQLRTALALSYAYERDNALKAIYSYPVPKDDLWAARYYLIKTDILQQTLYYGTPDLAETKTDPTKFTFNQKQDAIKEIYKNLWDMRKKLVNMPIEDAMGYTTKYFSSSSALILTPTLYDYLVGEWIYKEIQPKEAILEESYKLGGKNREAVREVWRIERILLAAINDENQITDRSVAVFSPNSRRTYSENPPKDLPVADMLTAVSGQKPQEDKGKFFFKAKEVLGKAKAALEAGTIYNAVKEYQTAVAALDYCLALPLNYFTDRCKDIKDGITNPRFYIEDDGGFNRPTGQAATIKINAANIDRLYMHIYNLPAEKFKSTRSGHWLTSPDREVRRQIVDGKPLRTIIMELLYKQKYAPADAELSVPYMAPGFYAVVLSRQAAPDEDDRMVFLNFTDLAAYVTAYSATPDLNKLTYRGSQFKVYSLDAATGKLQPSASLQTGDAKKYTTAKNGQLQIPAKNNDKTGGLLLQKDKSYAIVPNIYFNHSEYDRYNIIINTDRAVYRPGQEVKVKLNVIERRPPAYTAYSGKQKIKVEARDANYNVIERRQLALDNMGAADFAFTLPQESLLGNFNINARIENQSGYASISVEEYKRPEFEVSLKDKEDVSAYGKPLVIEGSALYYHGGAAPNAKVTYSISKTYFTPWFVWWWMRVEPDI